MPMASTNAMAQARYLDRSWSTPPTNQCPVQAKGLHAGRPDHDRRGHADGVQQPHVAQRLAECRVHAIPCVGQHAMVRSPFLQQAAQLRQRNLRLRREAHLFGHAGL